MNDKNGDKPRHSTIVDIARALDLSFSTVSRALSDHPHISDSTKARVRKTAAGMNYVPNAAARAIQKQKSNLVGLIIPDIENAFYAKVAKVVSERCAARGFQMVLAITEDDRDIELAHVQALRQARARAIAITPVGNPHPQTIGLLSQSHAVQLVRAVPGLDMPMIQVAEHSGIMEATRHLIDIGHTDIGFIGGSISYSTGAERFRGFQEAMKLANLEAPDHWVKLGAPRAQFGEEAMNALSSSERRPTAIVVAGYELTVGALRSMARLGISAPADVSIVAYGEIGSGVFKSFTTVVPPVQQMAASTAELLLRELAPHAHKHESELPIMFAATLLIGGSTGSPARP